METGAHNGDFIMPDCRHQNVVWTSLKHWWCHDCERLFESTPRETDDVELELTFAVKVDMFESRQHGWFFDPVRHALAATGETPVGTIRTGEYVALNTLCGYFEGIEKFREAGRTGNGDRFRASARRVMGSLGVTDGEINQLWAAVRNPMFHEGMTYSPVTVGCTTLDGRPIWTGEDARLQVDVEALLGAEIADFDAFIAELRSGSNPSLQATFERQWDHYWEMA